MSDGTGGSAVIEVYLDDAAQPIATYRPPATFSLDTALLEDGQHSLRFRAVDALGNASNRTMHFSVQNGPGITVTGLREGSRVSGVIDVNINAFGANEPFNPVRAESFGPIPVWTWVMMTLIAIWGAWYGLEFLSTPVAFQNTPTYAANPALAAGLAPLSQTSVQTAAPPSNAAAAGSKNVAAFDYSSLGSQVYDNHCMSCHGPAGAGTPGVFPALASDPVVLGKDATAHISIVLKGLGRKRINGVTYGAQMPAFASQLSDAEIAAVVDHERTSWGNAAPTVTPDQVKTLRSHP